MKFATYASPTGPRSSVLIVKPLEQPVVFDLQKNDPSLPTSLRELLARGDEAMQKARDILTNGKPLDNVPTAWLAPIPDARKIFGIGLNYADHAKETGATVGEEPVVFNKLPTTLRGHQQEIHLPMESDRVDFEAELVVVIGRSGRSIPKAAWKDHVAGYMCGNDVSARDWQKGKPGKQWLLGKSFDTFAPTGPYLVTADEVADPSNLPIELRLNGETMQQSNTSQLIFGIDYLIAYLSSVCTLEPGDLIFTGTPPGVGVARKPPIFLQKNDCVEIEIAGLGCLQNKVFGP